MAMEQLEVPSKSYLIRWVDCAAGHTISWSVQPHKKSLNFGIFRHPGGSKPNGSLDSAVSDTAPVRPTTSRRHNSNEGDAEQRLKQAGLQEVLWHGKCEAEKVATGTYQVKIGGMFALIFDNTFSKQISKTATFVLLTYPTNSPPPASHALHHEPTPSASSMGSGSLNRSPSVMSPAGRSEETLSTHHDGTHNEKLSPHSSVGFHTGVLKKRKRKKHQGYARRFFSLDYTSCTLSYYLNRESSALRGAIPLSLAAISASQKDREICIDSGAEIWHLRANTDAEWEEWTAALERAAQNAVQASTTGGNLIPTVAISEVSAAENEQRGAMEERGWAGVEALVGRVAGVRDAVRRLATTTPTSKPTPVLASASIGGLAGPKAGSSTTSVDSLEKDLASKRPFWKRKSSSPNAQPPTSVPVQLHHGSVRESHDPRRNSISSVATTVASIMAPAAPTSVATIASDHVMQQHLDALLTDLDSVVADFSKLVAENKQRRWLSRRASQQHVPPTSASRASFESSVSEEFFDAEELSGDQVAVLNDDENSVSTKGDQATDDEESDEESGFNEPAPAGISQPAVEKNGEKRDLKPLPLGPVQRRSTVAPAASLPPSLIGFLRKNVGKDLSTIAMPVSANEPISLLQRMAEQLDYSILLDKAANVAADGGERLLYVAAFAISSFSAARVKERSIRKPFNPMLGETYELVREDRKFRFLAEKVSHRPVIMACHADSPHWTFSQSPQPTQKFWGKSAELNTAGRVRISFPATGDAFSYTMATSFLRNIIAGEKYVEPEGSMHVHNENTGEKAVVTFKKNKGMFAGRSEEVSVAAFAGNGEQYPLSLVGKWTEDLFLVDEASGTRYEVWRVGPLVDGSVADVYGWTKFTAELNEITPIEKGHLPPSDSRLRPDQRMVEEGELDKAETVKHSLEEAQRNRRKEMEEAGENWKPRWFTRIGVMAEEEVWRINDDEHGYWSEREKGKWEDARRVFEMEAESGG